MNYQNKLEILFSNFEKRIENINEEGIIVAHLEKKIHLEKYFFKKITIELKYFDKS